MRLHRQARPDWMAGFAVRWEVPGGAHELVCFRWTQSGAVRQMQRDHNYWRRGPWRPVGYSVVPVSRRDFEVHRRRGDCRAPDCPQPVPGGLVSGGWR